MTKDPTFEDVCQELLSQSDGTAIKLHAIGDDLLKQALAGQKGQGPPADIAYLLEQLRQAQIHPHYHLLTKALEFCQGDVTKALERIVDRRSLPEWGKKLTPRQFFKWFFYYAEDKPETLDQTRIYFEHAPGRSVKDSVRQFTRPEAEALLQRIESGELTYQMGGPIGDDQFYSLDVELDSERSLSFKL